MPSATLEKILNAGTKASSSGNMQAYSIIVTTDPTIKQELYKPHFEQNMVLEAPVLVTFCADFHRMRKWLELREAPMNFDNLMSFMIGAIDAVLASQNVALAAEAEGLGICYMGTTLASCQEIARILKCPDHVVPVVGFSLGYAAEEPLERDRLPLENLVHHQTYRPSTENEIEAAYRVREKLAWPRFQNRGVENLAQAYTTLKYTRESHLEYSRTVLDCLKEKGFFEFS